VVVKRAYADLNLGDIEDLERGIAGRTPDDPEDIPYERGPKVYKNRIPLQYTFLNPTAVEVIGGRHSPCSSGIRATPCGSPSPLDPRRSRTRRRPDDRLVACLPAYITVPVKAGKKTIPLDPEQGRGLPLQEGRLAAVGLPDGLLDPGGPQALREDEAGGHVGPRRVPSRTSACGGSASPSHKIQPGPLAFAGCASS
jgi:hypothetical protein